MQIQYICARKKILADSIGQAIQYIQPLEACNPLQS